MSKIKFYYHEANSDLLAVIDKDTCYSHVGQHSGYSPEYIKECRRATLKEYRDLKKELKSIGYKL